MSDVTCIRFVGSEEIMGDIVSETETTITVRDPAVIMMVPNSNGQMQLGMLPWLPYSDQRDFEIVADKVVTRHKPSVELLNRYNSIFGSGIEIVSAGAIK